MALPVSWVTRKIAGEGPKPCKAAIIGMNPGRVEVAFGRPFVGKSGQLLDRLLKEAGLNREEIYLTNVYKYGTEDNAEPTPEEMDGAGAIEELRAELALVCPTTILVLGDFVLRTLIGRGGIGAARGDIFPLRAIFGSSAKCIPSFHPSAALRNPKYLSAIEEDLRVFKRTLEQDYADIPIRWTTEAVPMEDVPGLVTLDIEAAKTGQLKAVGVYLGGLPVYECPADDPKGWATFKQWFTSHVHSISAWNLKYELKWLMKEGLWRPDLHTEDPMLIDFLLNENKRHDLETVATIELGVKPWKGSWRDRIFAGDDTLTNEEIMQYNATDVVYEAELHPKLMAKLQGDPKREKIYRELLLPATAMFAEVERHGVYINVPHLVEAEGEVRAKRELARLAVREHLGDVNLNSPRQVSRALYGTLGLPVTEWTEGGQPSTNEVSLKRIRSRHPVVGSLLDYRKYEKQLSTYFEPYRDMVDENSRVYPEYYMMLVTGRTSSQHPNIQQIPRDPLVRSIVGAPPGKKLVIADYSQVELRVAAWVFQERRMLEAFRAGEDLHYLMAEKMTGKPRDQITKEERYRAKIPNFMFLYAGEEETYIMNALREFDLVLTMEEARRDREAYFSMWPDLEQAYAATASEIKDTGEVRSIFGRVRHLPDFRSNSMAVRTAALREGINFRIQSAASDLTMLAAVQIHRAGLGNIVAYIHDSVILEVDEGAADSVAVAVKSIMESDVPSWYDAKFGIEVGVPLVAETEVTDRWH